MLMLTLDEVEAQALIELIYGKVVFEARVGSQSSRTTIGSGRESWALLVSGHLEWREKGPGAAQGQRMLRECGESSSSHSTTILGWRR